MRHKKEPDIIQAAILKGKHISRDRNLVEKSRWEYFKKCRKGRKLFLFGGTEACDFFLNKYGNEFPVAAILDNDNSKTESLYSCHTKTTIPKQYTHLRIESPDILNQCKDRAIVIIASTNYYGEIARQLDEIGVSKYFSLLLMEAHKWYCIPYETIYHVNKLQTALTNRIYERSGWNRDVCNEVRQFYQMRKFPIQRNKIVFMTFGKYMDHGKYIGEEILRWGKGC